VTAKRPWGACIPDDVIQALLQDLDVELAEAWSAELAGPLTDDFFKLHDKPRLVGLGVEWGLHVIPSKSKEAMIKQLRASGRKPLPSCLVPAAKGAKPKKRKASR
jgi:hypothetical protein